MNFITHQSTRRHGAQRGFTLIELLIVIAILGILAAIGMPLYANVQARARVAKAQADTRAVASAITLYMAHCEGLPNPTSAATTCPTSSGAQANQPVPSALLAAQTNNQNRVAGPFLAAVPVLPAGWAGNGATYRYDVSAGGTLQVCGSGDGTAANSNGTSSCP